MNDVERRQKLEAMAADPAPPAEAEIACAKLADMGDRGRIPPQRPPTTGGIYPRFDDFWMTTNATAPFSTNSTIWFRFNTGGT